MPGFRHTLIVVVPLCDVDCAVTFTCEEVIVCNKQSKAVLNGWREATWPRLWQIDLPTGEFKPSQYAQQCKTGYIGGILVRS